MYLRPNPLFLTLYSLILFTVSGLIYDSYKSINSDSSVSCGVFVLGIFSAFLILCIIIYIVYLRALCCDTQILTRARPVVRHAKTRTFLLRLSYSRIIYPFFGLSRNPDVILYRSLSLSLECSVHLGFPPNYNVTTDPNNSVFFPVPIDEC